MIFSYEVELEYGAVQKFLLDKYKIDLDKDEKLKELIKNEIVFLQSLKVWQKGLETKNSKKCNINMYFQEMVSNSVHLILLSALNMVLPSFVMLRKTQELMLTFLYYREHPVELYKKEIEESTRSLLGLKELKEYIVTYPFSMKYNIESVKIEKLMKELIADWSKQYEELSYFVHSSNSKYFQSKNFLNDFDIEGENWLEKKEVNFKIIEDTLSTEKNFELLLEHTIKITSIFNALYIIFFFLDYIHLSEYKEKSIIRRAISAKYQYKEKIVELFQEI